MNITIQTINNLKVELQNIKEMSETKDGVLIFLPKCGTVPILIDGELAIYSEMPSIDIRTISSLNVILKGTADVNN